MNDERIVYNVKKKRKPFHIGDVTQGHHIRNNIYIKNSMWHHRAQKKNFLYQFLTEFNELNERTTALCAVNDAQNRTDKNFTEPIE